jgi:DNA-binding LytR/AlgR family response regulator
MPAGQINFNDKSTPMLHNLINEESMQHGDRALMRLFTENGTRRKTRMVVRKGQGFVLLRLEDIALFYTENKITYVLDREGKKFVGEGNLSEIEDRLDPAVFFRANRQYILNIDYIKSYKPYEKVKLQVDLHVADAHHFVVVSQENAPAFREWMNQA